MRHVLVYAVALLIAHNAVHANAADTPQCRDENNLPVDWFALYKFPKLKNNANTLIQTGDAYLFMTDRTVSLNQGWQLSTTGIGAAGSMLANTLAPLYNNAIIMARQSKRIYNKWKQEDMDEALTKLSEGVIGFNEAHKQ